MNLVIHVNRLIIPELRTDEVSWVLLSPIDWNGMSPSFLQFNKAELNSGNMNELIIKTILF